MGDKRENMMERIGARSDLCERGGRVVVQCSIRCSIPKGMNDPSRGIRTMTKNGSQSCRAVR